MRAQKARDTFLRMERPIRKTEQSHVTFDEFDLLDLLARREENPEAPGPKRVEEILDWLDVLYDDGSGVSKKRRAAAQLRVALDRYRWVRRLVPQAGGGLRVVCFAAEQRELSLEQAWEYGFVAWILSVIPSMSGRPPIRRCADDACREWFFAKKGNKKFCDGNCKQHHYDNDDVRKTKRKAVMKSLRADAKERAKNEKNGVGLRERATPVSGTAMKPPTTARRGRRGA